MVKYEKRGGDRKDSTKKAAEGRAVRRFSIVSDLSRTWSLDLPNVQVGLDRVQQYRCWSYN